jgi:hypothetical protein
MEKLIMGLIYLFIGIIFMLGFGYPMIASMLYPLYVKVGGKMSYEKYMAEL